MEMQEMERRKHRVLPVCSSRRQSLVSWRSRRHQCVHGRTCEAYPCGWHHSPWCRHSHRFCRCEGRWRDGYNLSAWTGERRDHMYEISVHVLQASLAIFFFFFCLRPLSLSLSLVWTLDNRDSFSSSSSTCVLSLSLSLWYELYIIESRWPTLFSTLIMDYQWQKFEWETRLSWRSHLAYDKPWRFTMEYCLVE